MTTRDATTRDTTTTRGDGTSAAAREGMTRVRHAVAATKRRPFVAGALRWTTLPTPLGDLLVAADDDGLTRASFLAGTAAWAPPADAARVDDDALLGEARAQLAAYFAGRLRAFDLPLAPRGTAFQRDVWRALGDVPYGATTTYGALAAKLGRPTAARAVGAANGANPLPVVVPCHRVVGADGALTGYLGGVALKRALLALEDARR